MEKKIYLLTTDFQDTQITFNAKPRYFFAYAIAVFCRQKIEMSKVSWQLRGLQLR